MRQSCGEQGWEGGVAVAAVGGGFNPSLPVGGLGGWHWIQPELAGRGVAALCRFPRAVRPACCVPLRAPRCDVTSPTHPPTFSPSLLPTRSAWALYYEYESEFAGWQALYTAAAEALHAAEAEDPAGGAAEDARSRLAALAQQTLPLLGAMLEFVGQRSLDCLVGWAEGGAAAALAAAEGMLPAEVAVVVGPDAGADTAPEVQQGAAFPSYAGLEEQQEAAGALQAALQAAAAAMPGAEQQLGVGAGPAQEDMPGLVAGALQQRSACWRVGAMPMLLSAMHTLLGVPSLPRHQN